MDAKAEGKRAGFTRLNQRHATVFSLDFTVEGVTGGRLDSGDIAVFLRGGVLPNSKVGKFGQVPANGGGKRAVGVGKKRKGVTFPVGLGLR